MLLAGCLIQCGKKPTGSINLAELPTRSTGAVLAKVGNEKLTTDDLFNGPMPPNVKPEDVQGAIDGWVETELWYQEAARKGLGQDETLQNALREQARLMARKGIAGLLLHQVVDTVTATDAEVYDYFSAHKGDYPVGIKIQYILMMDSAMAERALAALKGGADFKTTAREFSVPQIPESLRGAELPYFVRNDTTFNHKGDSRSLLVSSLLNILSDEPTITDAIFALKSGETSGLLTMSAQGGSFYLIVRCLDRKQLKSEVKFEDMKEQIRDQLKYQKQQEAQQDFEAQLRKKISVETHVENAFGGTKH